MGIEFKFNVKRKITINGKEYVSPGDVPEQYRHSVEEALDAADPFSGRGRLTVGGTVYSGPDELPPEARTDYVAALRRSGAGPAKPGLPQPPTAPERTVSGRTILIFLLVAGAVLLLNFLRHR